MSGLNPTGWSMTPNMLLLHPRYRQLNRSEVKTLQVILAHRDRRSGVAWPSQETIAEIAGFTRQTVAEAVESLRSEHPAGPFITTERRWFKGATRLVYRVPCLDQCRVQPTSVGPTNVGSGEDQCRESPPTDVGSSRRANRKNRRRTDENNTAAGAAEDVVVSLSAEDRKKVELLRTVEGLGLHAGLLQQVKRADLAYVRRLIPYAVRNDGSRSAAALVAAGLKADPPWVLSDKRIQPLMTAAERRGQKARAKRVRAYRSVELALDLASEQERREILAAFEDVQAIHDALDPAVLQQGHPGDVLRAIRAMVSTARQPQQRSVAR